MVHEGKEHTGEVKRKVSRRVRKPNLTIDTKAPERKLSKHDTSTPATEMSNTPRPSTPPNVRGSSDLRSPGVPKSPVPDPNPEPSTPDFITQTDRHGNATTPRSETAVRSARVQKTAENKEGEASEVDPCETMLDSIRLMCCCLLPEDAPAKEQMTKKAKQGESPSPEDSDTSVVKLLPKIHPDDYGKKCLVLDLDETLVHSSFRAVPGADFVIPVQIEDVVHFVYVAKRPGVDEFLVEMAKHYEIVIYTASLNKYADPLLDLLDPQQVIRTRLFRESCVFHEGNYVKDLSLLDRDLSQSIIVDNSPSSYMFHPENAIDCSSFIDDPHDVELDQIGAFLAGIKDVRDVRRVCHRWREWPHVDISDSQDDQQ
mmetsp:Transcript_24147/g.56343  ORF Transcript_24147/g.56343 Transcript_24147/m.56343 type:complete len:371 (-) Transcript_24147:94-1206(-)